MTQRLSGVAVDLCGDARAALARRPRRARRRQVAAAVALERCGVDRRRHLRDPEEHRGRADPRPAPLVRRGTRALHRPGPELPRRGTVPALVLRPARTRARAVDEWRAGTAPFPSVRVDVHTIIDLVAGALGVNVDHFCLVVDPVDLDAVARSGRFDVVGDGPVHGLFGARGNATSLYVRRPGRQHRRAARLRLTPSGDPRARRLTGVAGQRQRKRRISRSLRGVYGG